MREDREGRPWGVCDADGHRVIATANDVAADQVGRPVQILYPPTDADGGLREARAELPVLQPS